MGPAIGNNNNSANVNIRKIENGWSVSYNKEVKRLTKDGNSFLYDYVNEQYAFDDLEDALDQAQELLETDEEDCEECA